MPRQEHNPPNRYTGESIEWEGQAPIARLEIYEDAVRNILSSNDSPDIAFTHSLNPYRGCQHACAYCYARPSHSYWGFGAGSDFDRKIVVKREAPKLLRETFLRKSWRGESIVFSGNTDCYQPLEGALRITRACLEVCLEFRNPVGVITKSTLVARDADVLAALARDAQARVYFSIPFANDEMARAMEPGAPSPTRRFEAMRKLSDAGIPTGVSLSPMILGLNDSDVPTLLARARDAGADRAFMVPLRLALEVLPVFQERLAETMPDRFDKVMNAVREMRGGDRFNDARFGERMQGTGARWKLVEDIFRTHCGKLGFVDRESDPESPTTFRRPTKQLALF